jgi:hypothetical protein
MSPDKDEPHGDDRQPEPQPATQGAPAEDADAKSVEWVIAAELQQIARRRQAHGLGGAHDEQGASANVYEEAGRWDLVGLALSGGGIRSATFCLGVLQGLAGLTRLGPLKYLDYLSTVSGGGYIGSWFAAWARRAGGHLEEVERLLKPKRIDQQPQGREPSPIFHLRRYSNYLSPRLGVLSADVWVLWASYVRNFLVCQLVLLPATVFVLLLSRLFLLAYHAQTPEYFAGLLTGRPDPPEGEVLWLLGAWEWVIGFLIGALWFAAAVFAFLVAGRVPPDGPGAAAGPKPGRLRRLALAVVPLLYANALIYWVVVSLLGLREWAVGLLVGALWFVAAACAVRVAGRKQGRLRPLILAAVPLLYANASVYWLTVRWAPGPWRSVAWFGGTTLALWLVAVAVAARLLRPPPPATAEAGLFRVARRLGAFLRQPRPDRREQGPSPWLFPRVVLPLLAAALLFCLVPALRLYKLEHPKTEDKGPELVLGVPGLPAPPPSAAAGVWRYLAVEESVSRQFFAFLFIPAFLVAAAYLLALLWHRRWHDALAHLSGALAASVAGGALLYYACQFLIWLSRPGPGELSDFVTAQAAARVTTFGPPLVLGVIVLTIFLGIALLRNRLGEGLREWWSRLCAKLMIWAAVWMFVNLVAIYATALIIWASPWARAALGSGWLLTVAGGVLAGATPRTDGLKPRRGPLDWLALLAPPVFVVGLLVGVSLLLHALLDTPPNWERGLDTADWMRREEPPHPAVRVSDTTRSFWGLPLKERLEVTERARVFDDLRVASRVYWLGMFNTDAAWVPQPKYLLTKEDVLYLREKRNLPEKVADTLEALRRKAKGDALRQRGKEDETPDWFRGQYAPALAQKPAELGKRYAGGAWKLRPADKALPGEVTQEELLQIATDAYLIQPNPGKVLLKLLIALGACLALLVLAAWRVDVNLFSLHALYGNRLTRCYLGASHSGRKPDPFIGFDPRDDLLLAALEIPPHAEADEYDGPYLLANATLNLVGGSELAWQERKAEPFLFSPLRCGSPQTGFRPTARYAGGVPLSTAMTVSGAAVSPNSGYSSSTAVTVLLTVFNARLGAWLGNPKSATSWERPGPRSGFLHLFRELLGLTDDTSGYVYLSDGGHFENLGGYELVRRRCRFVIVVDADCDGQHLFENLGNLIRKCRNDFGIPIEIDLGALRRAADTGRVRWHCAVGKVRYDHVDFGALPGTLVYLKPSLSGDEPPDVLHYAAQHPDFPHETTADQFFSESQFESYRALGQHVAETVFADAVEDVGHELDELKRLGPAATAGEKRRTAVRALFASVARRWFALPPEYEASFLQSTRGYIDLHRAMADDARLRQLTRGMYPELDAALRGADGAAIASPHPVRQALEVANAVSSVLWPRPEEANRPADGAAPAVARAGQACAEVHTLVQMLQIMENAWLSLNLDVHYAHPLNRGWMDIFYRWTNTPLFRRHWPVLRSEFARGFVSFCEKQVHMGHVEVECEALPADRPLPDVLTREFEDEWTEWGPGGLQQRRRDAGRQPRCWLIHARMADPGGRLGPPPKETPCGLVLVWHDPPGPERPDEPWRAFDFLIWVRGAHRNCGIGREAVFKILKELHDQKWPAPPFRLIVRLPVGNLTGPGGSLLRSMWETFFHHLDFHPLYQPPGSPTGAEVAPSQETILEREFRGAQRQAAAPAPQGGG